MLVSTDAIQASAQAVLGALRAYTSSDVVAHANSLSSWQQQYDQLVGGAFQGALEELWFEDVQVFRERTSHAVRQICRIREDAVWCGVTVTHDGSRIEGQEVFDHMVRHASSHGASCYFASVGIANSTGKTEEEMTVPVKGVAYNVAFDGLLKMALPEAD